ncbi:MAG: Asp-tRNA(Asn)/Glu-tRNA(Gln) amidotransferase subunit GatB, partial [Usitatibacter sp.]
ALNRAGIELSAAPVSSASLAGLLRRVADGTISGRTAKEVFDAMWDGATQADAVIESRGLRQISDAGALEAAVAQALAANPKLVEDYRSGKEKAFNALVGQVMKATRGQGNPQEVNRILRERLAS